MSSKKLTTEFVRKVKPPKSGRAEHFDALLPGFCLRVTSNNAKSYCCFYRLGGRLRRYTIGNALKISLDDARQQARDAFTAAMNGRDMAAKKRADRQAAPAPALPRLFETQAREFFKRQVEGQRTAKQTEAIIAKDLIGAWAGRLASDISRADVNDLLDACQDKGHVRARNRRLGIIRRMWNWFIERGVAEINPAERIKNLKENKRQRVLTDDELRAIWNAASSMSKSAGTFIKLLALTGQRRSEVAAIEWSEIDEAAKLWSIPGSKYKTGIPHLVPLTAPVLGLLADLPRFKNGSGTEPFALTTSGKRPLTDFSALKDAVDEISGVTGWTFHDIRRSVRTRLSQIGINSDVAERVLGHVPGGVRGIYDRHDFLSEKANALNMWARTLQAIVENTGGGNVVALRNRSADDPEMGASSRRNLPT